MKVPLSWLNDYTKIEESTSEMSHKMTMAGTEVGNITEIGAYWDDETVVVGEIISIEKHPNADRLRLATVHVGKDELIKVVCGATNLSTNQKIAFAREGAILQNPVTKKTEKLKAAKIRGFLSKGMICSELELGISEEHEGILELPSDKIPGTPLKNILGDTILETELTPNRPDCLSIIGTAQEIAAISNTSVNIPNSNYPVNDSEISDLMTVEIENPMHCIRYSATLVKNIRIEPSPLWMQSRLKKCGVRPINNVVDITNYVMLEYGQPLHAFDRKKLKDNHIIIRESKDNEKITTLDGMDRKLTKGMLVIADRSNPIALAGIMGGQSTEIDDSTDTIFLESANFSGSLIRSTRTKIGLTTEASYRFERELRHEIGVLALKRATELLVSICGGNAYKGIIDEYPQKIPSIEIKLNVQNLNSMLGTDFNKKTIWNTLKFLGFQKESSSKKELLKLTPPLWRSDIKIEEDAIEEFARIYGYDNLPVKRLSSELPTIIPDKIFSVREKIRDSLVYSGMNEVISYSVSNIDSLKKTQTDSTKEIIKLLNPMDSTKGWLRSNLIANLLETLATNQRNNNNNPIKIFEIGHIFSFDENYHFGDLPTEEDSIVGLITGNSFEENLWDSDNPALDFYHLKGIIDNSLNSIMPSISYSTGNHFILNSHINATITCANKDIGIIGQLDDSISSYFGLQKEHPVFIFELHLPTIVSIYSDAAIKYKQISKFPDSKRDISLLVDTNIESKTIENIIAQSELVSRVYPIDNYTGEDIPKDKKSITYRIIFQSNSKTLDTLEIDNIQAKLMMILNKKLNIIERYSV